jgi:hypothetical protein
MGRENHPQANQYFLATARHTGPVRLPSFLRNVFKVGFLFLFLFALFLTSLAKGWTGSSFYSTQVQQTQ